MDDLLGGGFALYVHMNVLICFFGLMMLNLRCIHMDLQEARGSKTFLAYQWLVSAVLCDYFASIWADVWRFFRPAVRFSWWLIFSVRVFEKKHPKLFLLILYWLCFKIIKWMTC